MADSPDELDPTQATEAKLCAYLEGTLSATERVEIEKYLSQSPTHRKLLRDLATTRKWVSELPRELAPPDIAELFEQHVERNMLLDDSASAVSVRINRGPQVMLAAAILLLAVGLGAIIFIVLNAKGPTAQNYASSMKETIAGGIGSAPKGATPATAPIPETMARSVPILPPPGGAPAAIPAAPAAAGISDAAVGTPALPQRSAAVPSVIQNGLLTQGLSAAKPSPATLPIDSALAVVPSTFAPSATTRPVQTFAIKAAISNATSEPAIRANAAVNDAAHTEAALLAPTTQPAIIAVGDRLLVDIPQLVGPGVEKTTTVRVDNDGKIALPMLDAMPAAGQTMITLQKQIADRYRDENLIANPVVTVTRVPSVPSSLPATEPSTQPTTRPAP